MWPDFKETLKKEKVRRANEFCFTFLRHIEQQYPTVTITNCSTYGVLLEALNRIKCKELSNYVSSRGGIWNIVMTPPSKFKA